jgi:glutathione S-transferase
MITLRGFGPAWTLPCLSPFVTKVAYYMRLTGIEYEFVPVNPFELRTATPFGKVPVIKEDGKTVADSTAIIDHLERTRGEPLNKGATERERAVMLAFNRLLDEHFYWCAVILPRWRNQQNWENYIPILCGGRQPDKALRDARKWCAGPCLPNSKDRASVASTMRPHTHALATTSTP